MTNNHTMSDNEAGLLFLLVILLGALLLTVMIYEADWQDAQASMFRPTALPGTPTYEVFLPIVQADKPTATPIPRPTIGG